jgi:hypothetical protein
MQAARPAGRPLLNSHKAVSDVTCSQGIEGLVMAGPGELKGVLGHPLPYTHSWIPFLSFFSIPFNFFSYFVLNFGVFQLSAIHDNF